VYVFDTSWANDLQAAYRPRQTRLCLLVGGVEGVVQVRPECRHEVGVQIQRCLYGAVAKPRLDLLWVCPLLDQEGRAGVPKIVEADIGIDAGGLKGRA
jgi:hypothetical protein